MLKTKLLGTFIDGAYVYAFINNTYILCSIISAFYKIIETPDGKRWMVINDNNEEKLLCIGS